MRVLLILPLLLVAVNGRPQIATSSSTSTTAADWKPIETEFQSQRLRYSAQLREIQNYYRNFVPINYYTSPTNNTYRVNGNTITPKAFVNTVRPRRKIQIKYKIANITSIKEQAKINRNKNKIQRPKLKPSIKPNKNRNTTNSIQSDHKNWPDGELHTLEDFINYDKYITSTVAPLKNKKPLVKKPEVHQIFTKVSENPIKSNNNKWFEIKVRPPPSYVAPTTETNIQTIPDSIPIDIIENSNPFPVKIPGTNINDQLTVNIPPINLPTIQIPTANEVINNNNKVHIGTTVHLKPENDETLKPVNGLSNPCPEITITSNTVYNKEVCPDLDITINNHFQTNTNVFTDPPLVEEPVEIEDDPIEEPIEEDYPEDDFEEPEIEPAVEGEEEVVAEDGLGESAASSGQESGGGSQGSNNNRPQLPNLPGLPQNDNDSNEDSESFLDTGLSILGLLNPFNYPLISLVIAPLALILTGSLGLTTFFVPWTLFPTVFLSRKAKNLSPDESGKPDGWFWHNTYRTWANFNNNSVKDNLHTDSNRAFKDSLPDLILRLIKEFDDKYYDSNLSKSWKRRKKS